MPSAPAVGRAKTVLVVDDDEEILDSLSTLLSVSLPGYRILTAPRAREALSVLRRERVDLIITDYLMPDMDGLEFLAEVRTLGVTAPRVMITAYPDPDLAAKAVTGAGAALLITKPFDMDYFVRVMRSLVA